MPAGHFAAPGGGPAPIPSPPRGPEEAPRGSRCDNFAEVRSVVVAAVDDGVGPRPPLPHAATDPRHPPPSAAAGRPRPGGVGRGPPADGPRAGAGPRRVPGRPGRSHSGWLISKRQGQPPADPSPGMPGGPAPRRRPSPRGRAPGGAKGRLGCVGASRTRPPGKAWRTGAAHRGRVGSRSGATRPGGDRGRGSVDAIPRTSRSGSSSWGARDSRSSRPVRSPASRPVVGSPNAWARPPPDVAGVDRGGHDDDRGQREPGPAPHRQADEAGHRGRSTGSRY